MASFEFQFEAPIVYTRELALDNKHTVHSRKTNLSYKHSCHTPAHFQGQMLFQVQMGLIHSVKFERAKLNLLESSELNLEYCHMIVLSEFWIVLTNKKKLP